MRMYDIILSNLEKAVHALTYRFFWKGLCFDILSQLDDTKDRLFECNLFWIGQYGHFPTLILEEELIKY